MRHVESGCFTGQAHGAAGRGPVNPPKQGYGNGILKLPLDLSKVEDYFIPANGVFLDDVGPIAPSHLVLPLLALSHAFPAMCVFLDRIRPSQCIYPCRRFPPEFLESPRGVSLPFAPPWHEQCSRQVSVLRHARTEQRSALQNDLDLGASGAIIMADKQLVITGGKQGPIYLAKALNLGGYDPAANNTNVFEVIPNRRLQRPPAQSDVPNGPCGLRTPS